MNNFARHSLCLAQTALTLFLISDVILNWETDPRDQLRVPKLDRELIFIAAGLLGGSASSILVGYFVRPSRIWISILLFCLSLFFSLALDFNFNITDSLSRWLDLETNIDFIKTGMHFWLPVLIGSLFFSLSMGVCMLVGALLSGAKRNSCPQKSSA